MSATPIDNTYLNALPEFQNVDYYKLKWDPKIIVEPTVREIMMRKDETTQSILTDIISKYRRDGYFAHKIVNGVNVEAKEIVVFVNEVKTILQIIKDNNLRPDEVTVLVSSSNKYAPKFKKLGIKIESQTVNRTNPQNKIFTFCSKASFEGRDFYSTSAFTYIFIDGTKDWEIHDTAIEIPQMLGRQRLDENPFRYNTVIYYHTKPSLQSPEEYLQTITNKLITSQAIVNNYENGNDDLKRSLVSLVKNQDPSNRYQSNYLEVIDNADGSYSIEINLLVAAAEHNLSVNKAYFYSNPLFLTTAIHSQMESYNSKPPELRDFEKSFNAAQTFGEKMRLYSEFRSSLPQYDAALLSNPFIEFEYHDFYHQLGPEEMHRLNYDKTQITTHMQYFTIQTQCQAYFQRGKSYTAAEVKATLQAIYDNLGLNKIATASQLSDYIPTERTQPTQPDGTRPRLYLIK